MYNRIIIFLVVFAQFLLSCSEGESPEKSSVVEYLGSFPEKPFSEAVRVGDFLILSGQIGIDPGTGKLIPGGITAETRQTMENIKTTLGKYGSSLDRVVKCTVMLADIQEWGEMNKVYTLYFQKHKPTRSAFGATGLALDARVEIECWAVLN